MTKNNNNARALFATVDKLVETWLGDWRVAGSSLATDHNMVRRCQFTSWVTAEVPLNPPMCSPGADMAAHCS